MQRPFKIAILLIIQLNVLAGCTSTQPQPNETKTNQTTQEAKRTMIHVKTLQPGNVIGRLGAPLGKVITVAAEIVDGNTLKRKAMMGVWMLRIKRVGEQTSNELMLVEGVELPKTHGASIKLIGYETGQFIGTPSEAFKHIPAIATRGFSFETHFVALKKA